MGLPLVLLVFFLWFYFMCTNDGVKQLYTKMEQQRRQQTGSGEVTPATTIASVTVEDLQLRNALRAKQVQIVESDQVSDPHDAFW